MKSRMRLAIAIVAGLALLAVDRASQPAGGQDGAAATSADAATESAGDLFSRRILPILNSTSPSSCTECHFGGVELKNYIRGDQLSTFAALREEGLIDVKQPARSKILEFISRRGDSTDPLLAKVRAAEFQAFDRWIQAAVRDPQLLAAKSIATSVGNELPAEVIRHMRRDHVLQSFVESVWVEVGRCINCHSPERNQKLVAEHGEQISWIVPRDPAATLKRCVALGVIDTDQPEESLILRKPLVLVEHGGGPKFVLASRTDKNFRRFLNDYAAVVNQKYERKEQLPPLPAEIRVPTNQQLRVTDLPQQFDKKLLRVDIYRWTGAGWSDSPWAIAENAVDGPKRLCQSEVFAVAPRDSPRATELHRAGEVQLPAGRYLAKIYIDREGKAQTDRDFELGNDALFGETEFAGDWPPGYQPPKIIRAPR